MQQQAVACELSLALVAWEAEPGDAWKRELVHQGIDRTHVISSQTKVLLEKRHMVIKRTLERVRSEQSRELSGHEAREDTVVVHAAPGKVIV